MCYDQILKMTSAIVILTAAVFALSITFSQSVNALTADLSSSEANDSSSSPNVTSACVTFNSEERMITISCKTANLTQIDNQLKDSDVIHKDAYIDKGWILNA